MGGEGEEKKNDEEDEDWEEKKNDKEKKEGEVKER